MTKGVRTALRLGIPRILITSAILDGVLEQLIGAAVDDPAPDPPTPEEAIVKPVNTSSPALLDLFDRNGIYIRKVSLREAGHMVDRGQGEPVMPGGWRDRTDVEWTGIRLTITPDPVWSETSLTHQDTLRIAGVRHDAQHAARIKFAFWPVIHDDLATMVVPR